MMPNGMFEMPDTPVSKQGEKNYRNQKSNL